MLPESAFMNAMQDLNANSNPNSHGKSSEQNNKINFYAQTRHDTDHSMGQAQVMFEKQREFSDQEQVEEEIEDPRSRNNILNGGRQLSLMTVCSDVLDNSADLKFDYF